MQIRNFGPDDHCHVVGAVSSWTSGWLEMNTINDVLEPHKSHIYSNEICNQMSWFAESYEALWGSCGLLLNSMMIYRLYSGWWRAIQLVQ